MYDLVTPLSDPISADPLVVPVTEANTAEISVMPYAHDTPTGVHLGFSRRNMNFEPLVETHVQVRLGTEFENIVTASPDIQYWNGMDLGRTGLAEFAPGWSSYEPGSEDTVEWLRAGNAPRTTTLNELHSGDQMDIRVGAQPFPPHDTTHLWSLATFDDSVTTTLYRNGELAGSTTSNNGVFRVSAGSASFEAVNEATRTIPGWAYASKATTRWRFDAGSAERYSVISMPQVTWDVDLALDNSVQAGRSHPLTVTARPWDRRGPDVTDVAAWVSYDHGVTWTELSLTSTGDDAVLETSLKPPASADSVSLRTRATDADGHQVEVSVEDAYGVRTGS